MDLSVVCQYRVSASRFDWRLVAAMAGLLLVLNPVYLFPAGGQYVQTYSFAPERVDDSLTLALSNAADSTVHFCDVSPDRTCLLERQVGSNGSLVITDSAVVEDVARSGEVLSSYEYVHLESGFYGVNSTVSNESVTLTLRSVNATTVAEYVARDYESAPDAIQRAIDTGEASVTYSTPGDVAPSQRAEHRVRDFTHELVEKNGSFYLVRDSAYRGRTAWYAEYLGFVRLAMILLGFGLVLWAFQYPTEGTE